MFTGSKLLPEFLHAPAPFKGTTTFTYTAENDAQATDDATVTIVVHPREAKEVAPTVEPGDGFAKNDSTSMAQSRTKLINVSKNDVSEDGSKAKVVAINGQTIAPGKSVSVDGGTVTVVR